MRRFAFSFFVVFLFFAALVGCGNIGKRGVPEALLTSNSPDGEAAPKAALDWDGLEAIEGAHVLVDGAPATTEQLPECSCDFCEEVRADLAEGEALTAAVLGAEAEIAEFERELETALEEVNSLLERFPPAPAVSPAGAHEPCSCGVLEPVSPCQVHEAAAFEAHIRRRALAPEDVERPLWRPAPWSPPAPVAPERARGPESGWQHGMEGIAATLNAGSDRIVEGTDAAQAFWADGQQTFGSRWPLVLVTAAAAVVLVLILSFRMARTIASGVGHGVVSFGQVALAVITWPARAYERRQLRLVGEAWGCSLDRGLPVDELRSGEGYNLPCTD